MVKDLGSRKSCPISVQYPVSCNLLCTLVINEPANSLVVEQKVLQLDTILNYKTFHKNHFNVIFSSISLFSKFQYVFPLEFCMILLFLSLVLRELTHSLHGAESFLRTNSRSPIQEISRLLWNLNVHYRITRALHQTLS